MNNTVYEYIKENPDSSVKQISHYTELTEDSVRYQIKTLKETLIKSPGRPARFSINSEHLGVVVNLEEEFEEMKIETDIADLEEAIKKDKPKRKILTSQAQLNKMVDSCWDSKVKMKYSREERYWIFTKGSSWTEGEIQIKVKSKELPDIRTNLSKWIKENFNEI